MLGAILFTLGAVLIAAGVANGAYFLLRARRGAIPQPVRADQER